MKRLTITFDNGPDPACTPAVLDALAERDVRATFFVCGQGNTLHPASKARAPEAMAVLERAVAEGHWIGNHSLSHAIELGTTRDPEIVAREIGGNEAILRDLNPHRLFRPYMGGGIVCARTFSPEAIEYLCRHDYTVVMFNCVPRDWEDPEGWPETALAAVEDRDWTLLIVHDVARYGSMASLPRFLDTALARGVEIVQDFPPDCVPIRKGKVVGSLDGMLCGEEAEEPHPLSVAAAERVN